MRLARAMNPDSMNARWAHDLFAVKSIPVSGFDEGCELALARKRRDAELRTKRVGHRLAHERPRFTVDGSKELRMTHAGEVVVERRRTAPQSVGIAFDR